jgi:hypothetical protein
MIDGSDAAGAFPESSHTVDPPLRSDPAGAPGNPAPDVVYDDRPASPVPAGQMNQTAVLLAGISEAVRELAVGSERYHARAEQRESVIDHLRDEVERLRRGERRGLLRPLLAQMCRLRNDLLRQAEDLPGDFDAERARLLLRSYADSVELALEDSGVVTFTPSEGDTFEPRMHRRVGSEPASDSAIAGRVASVKRSGYLDVDANSAIAPAEVVLFGPGRAAPADAEGSAAPPTVQSDPATDPDGHDLASGL